MKVEVTSKFNVCIDTVKGTVLKPKEISEVVPSERIKYLVNNKFLKIVDMPKEAKTKPKMEVVIEKPKVEPVKVDMDTDKDNEDNPQDTETPQPKKVKKRKGRKKNINPFLMEDD